MTRNFLVEHIHVAMGMILVPFVLLPTEVLMFVTNPGMLGYFSLNVVSIIFGTVFAISVLFSLILFCIGVSMLINSLPQYLRFSSVKVSKSNKKLDLEDAVNDLVDRLGKGNVGLAQARGVLWAIYLKSRTFIFPRVSPRKLSKHVLFAQQICPNILSIDVRVVEHEGTIIEQLWIKYMHGTEEIEEKIAIARSKVY